MAHPKLNPGPHGRQRWRVAGWSLAALLMLLPVAGQLLLDGMHWSGGDFALFGAMLLAAGGALEFLARRARDRSYCIGAVLAVGSVFLLVWTNAAVGVIGSEDNPANLMVPGVLVVGIATALASRFTPLGMARALSAMAMAQAAVALVSIAAGWGTALVGSAFFCGLWLLSAWLFRRSAAAGDR